MPAPTTARRRTPAVLTAAAAAAALGLLAGCSDGGHEGPPGPLNPTASAPPAAAGTASVLARIPAGTPLAAAVTARPATPGGLTMSSGSDGSLLLAVPGYVARLGPRGALTPAAGPQDGPPRGVAGLPDGSFVTAVGGRLLRVVPGQRPQTIAGTSGAPRAASAPVPAAGSATGTRFTRDLTPVGSIADGSLVLADGNVVWRLRVGKVTALYRGDVRGLGYAVTPAGALYLVPRGAGATLGGIRVVPHTGPAAPLKLPASVPGVPGDPAALTPLSVSSDGKDGVYVHARRGPAAHPTGDWILHVGAGTAQVTAASTAPATTTCAVKGTVPAKAVPCALPQAVTSQPGLLVLAGGAGYVLGIHMPRGE